MGIFWSIWKLPLKMTVGWEQTCCLPGEEGFNQAVMEENIPQELLRYLKQQNLSSDPLLPAMQRLQSGMNGTLSRSDLGEDEKLKAKQFLQLQNRYLTFKQQLNTPLPARNKPEEMRHQSASYFASKSRRFYNGNSALYSPKPLQRGTKFKSRGHLTRT